jgi:hypothetical protein
VHHRHVLARLRRLQPQIDRRLRGQSPVGHGPLRELQQRLRGGAPRGHCDATFDDCDGLYPNGCEAALPTDAKNCGSCGHACAGANSTQACQGGACTITQCAPGFADCDLKPDTGCETAITTDVVNCGGCGNVCAMLPNSTPSCTGGHCDNNVCLFGYAHCSANPAEGCEVNVLSSPQNCGKCGNVCAAPANATAGCSGGKCGVGACSPLWGDCDLNAANGCEKDLSGDLMNCGACGSRCGPAHSMPACLNGQCGIVGCNPGWADCDGQVANGCETNIAADAANCGMCGNRCPMNQANCLSGACSNAVVFSADFVNGGWPKQQCTDWLNFAKALTGTYTSITIKGTLDPVGKTCNVGPIANLICADIHKGMSLGVQCNGMMWTYYNCSGGADFELAADGSSCKCVEPGYAVAACEPRENWGGVNSSTCGPGNPDQNITVICQ